MISPSTFFAGLPSASAPPQMQPAVRRPKQLRPPQMSSLDQSPTLQEKTILIRAGNPTFLSQSVITLLELVTNPKGRHSAKLVNTPSSYEIGYTDYLADIPTYIVIWLEH